VGAQEVSGAAPAAAAPALNLQKPRSGLRSVHVHALHAHGLALSAAARLLDLHGAELLDLSASPSRRLPHTRAPAAARRCTSTTASRSWCTRSPRTRPPAPARCSGARPSASPVRWTGALQTRATWHFCRPPPCCGRRCAASRRPPGRGTRPRCGPSADAREGSEQARASAECCLV